MRLLFHAQEIKRHEEIIRELIKEITATTAIDSWKVTKTRKDGMTISGMINGEHYIIDIDENLNLKHHDINSSNTIYTFRALIQGGKL